MANLSNVQNQIDILKGTNEYAKKSVLEPQNISDVRQFINEKKWTKWWETHEVSFKEWEDLIKNFESDKNKVTDKIATATASAATTVNKSVTWAPASTVGTTKNILSDIDKQIQKWEFNKKLDVMSMEKLESSLKDTENIAKLIPVSHTALGRWVVGSMMLGRLQELWYHVWINADNTVFVESIHKDAIDVTNKINAQIRSSGSVMSDIIRSGMLSMSPSFRQYASSKTIDGKVASPQSSTDYKQYLDLQLSKDPKAVTTFSDRSFLSSYSKGGFNKYDLSTMISQSRDLQKVWAFVESHPAIVAQVQSLTANPSIVSSTIIAPSVVSSTPDTKAGKAAGVVGETVGTVAGATGAVIWTVATETVSTWWTILSEATKTGWAMWAIGVIGLLIGSIWKFGFWKTMMGVVGIGWASAIANAAENGTLDKITDKMRKGADKLGKTVDKVTGDASVAWAAVVWEKKWDEKPTDKKEETKETDWQKLISDKIRELPEFKKIIESASLPGKKNNASLDKYLSFINNDLKDKNAEVFYKPKDSNHSIFTASPLLDTSIALPPGFDPMIFKSIMRMYLTGTYMPSTKMDEPANVDIIKKAFWKVTSENPTLSQALGLIQK
jgi:hypothetical protein